MTREQIVGKVKEDLRMDFDDLDGDIADNISAALLDLGIAGIDSGESEMDAICLRAVKLFCRWQYNFDGYADRYERAYNALKIVLALDVGHKAVDG